MGYKNTGTIRTIDTSDLVFMLNGPAMKRGHAPASQNSGTIPVAEGDAGPGTITATLTNMASGYGYRRDLAAFNFDDNDDVVNMGDVAALNSATKLSFEVWCRTPTIDNSQYLFDKRDAGSDNFVACHITPVASGTMNFYVKTAGTLTVGSFEIGSVVSDGETFHVRWEYDGSGAANADRLKLWVNGTARTLSFTGTIPASIPDLTGIDLLVGDYRSGGLSWGGQIYTPAFYNNTGIADHSALAPDMGLEMFATGQLVDPTAAAPAAVTGSAHRLGNCTHQFEVSLRDEYDHVARAVVAYIDESRWPSDCWSRFTQSDLSDLRISLTDGTECPRYLTARCSKSGQTAGLFVRIPASGSGKGLVFQMGGSAQSNGDPYVDHGASSDQAAIRALEFCGGDAVDIKGLATLTKHNTPTFPSGPFGTHLHLVGGSSQYVSDADADDLSRGNGTTDEPFSIITVLRPQSVENVNVLDRFAPPNEYLTYWAGASGTPEFSVYDSVAGGRRGRKSVGQAGVENIWITAMVSYNGDETDPMAGIDMGECGEITDVSDNSSGTYNAMSNTANDNEIGKGPGGYSSMDMVLHLFLPYQVAAEESRMLHDVFQGTFLHEDNAAFDIASSTTHIRSLISGDRGRSRSRARI